MTEAPDTYSGRTTGCVILAVTVLFIAIGVYMPRVLAAFPGVLALVMLACGSRYRTLNNFMPRPAEMAMAAIFPVLGMLSALWALEPGDALERGLKLCPLILPVPFILAVMRRQPASDKHIWIVPALLFAGLGLIWIEQTFNFPIYRLIRDVPQVPHHSVMNRSMVMAILLLFAALPFLRALPFFAGQHPARLLAVLSLVVIPVMIGSKSQSAQMAFLLAGLMILLFPVQKIWAWRAAQTILLAGFLFAPFLAMWGYSQFADMAGANPAFTKAAVAQRLEIWNFVSHAIIDRPVLGYGTEAARNMIFDTKALYFKSNHVLHPHNFVLQIWLEFGVIGIAVLSAMVTTFLEAMRRYLTPWQQKHAIAVLFAWMAVATTGYGIWQSWWIGLTGMMIVLTVAALPYSRKKETENER